MRNMQFYDSLETRDPEAREVEQFEALPNLIARAKRKAPGWADILDDIDADAVTSREALAGVPVTRKSDLVKRQAASPPFGGLTTTPAAEMERIFASPGPIFEPEGKGEDWWRMGRALYAAGFRKGDILHNSFSYHLTPGGFILDSGARSLGCTVVPAGTGNTDTQAELIGRFQPTGYTGAPDYLKILLDRAEELKIGTSSLTRALVSGGPLFPSLRAEYQDRGIAVFQSYATADVGLIAYETAALEGMVIDEGVIVEIVRPGTGDPVPVGDVGEVVVTSFNPDYPMIRLGTGDMSAILPGLSPCGRTNMRIKGWLGRADQATKVKGMFVRPEQIAEIGRRYPHVGRLRLVVTRAGESDSMILQVESGDRGVAEAMAATLQDVTRLRGEIVIVAPGSLPNDGVVIADARKLT